MQLKAKIWNGMEEWVWGELERKNPRPNLWMMSHITAHLVHCVASLQALMFLQYTLFASPGFSDSSLAVLSVYIQPFTVNLYVETPVPCNHLLQLRT